MHAASAARCGLKSAAAALPRSAGSSCPSSPSRTSGRCTPTPMCGIPPLALPKQALSTAAAALAALSLAPTAVDAPPSTAGAPVQQQEQQCEEPKSFQVPPPPHVDPIEAENEALAEFVSWLIANGVTGLSEPDARVGIYAEPIETSNGSSSSSGNGGRANGASSSSSASAAAAAAAAAAPPGLNRGVLALRDFAAGEELFRVPLRLAITDHVTKGGRSGIGGGGATEAAPSSSPSSTSSSSYDEDDAEAGRHRGEPSAWGARLASRLLREKARGRASPWAPWLAVLPTTTTMTTVPPPPPTSSEASTAAPPVSVARPGSLRSAWAGALPREVAALLPCPAAAAALLRASAAADAEFSRLPRSALATARAASVAASAPSRSSPPANKTSDGSGIGAEGIDDAAALACYRWARAVVQSRTFGSTAKEDGSGSAGGDAAAAAADSAAASPPSSSPPPSAGLVRMLVPLADFVNHAGDEAEVLLSGRRAPTANAEWKVAADDGECSGGGGGGWSLVVSSTRPLVAGEEVTFSYGERRNADFLVSYGFVPSRNPHDAVCLFEGVGEAVEWAARRLGISSAGAGAACGGRGVGGSGDDGGDAAAVPSSLLSEAVAAADAETTAGLDASSKSRDPEIAAEARRLWLWAGASVDERLVAALRVVAGYLDDGGAELRRSPTTAAELVAARAAELLSRSGAPPLADALGELERAGEHEHEEQHYFRALKRRYAAKEPSVRRAAAAAAASAVSSAGDDDDASAAAAADIVAAPVVAPAAPLPPPPPRGGSRSVWRGVRLMALRAGVYSTMILWDALEAADKAAGGGGATASAKKKDVVEAA